MYECGDKISRKVHRCDSGFRHDNNDTVLDVVLYEEEELGNNIGYNHEFDDFFSQIPANKCKWVGFKGKDVLRYGKAIETWITDNAIVIGDDGGGGYLIVEL